MAQQRVSWESIIHRSVTDRDFRASLLRDPTALLRRLGALGEEETALALEWTRDQKVLVLPPPIDASPARIAQLRDTFGTRAVTAAHREPARSALRPPLARGPVSTPLTGPSACRVGRTGPR